VPAGHGCAIAASAVLEGCVLWDRVTVGAGCRLQSCVVADGVTVPPGAQFDRRALVRRDAAAPRDCDIVVDDLLAAPLDAFRRQEAR
jgi:ADP-glucose pyrophosphorylase